MFKYLLELMWQIVCLVPSGRQGTDCTKILLHHHAKGSGKTVEKHAETYCIIVTQRLKSV